MTSKENIFNILNKLAMPCHIKGRKYIEEAVEIILEKGRLPMVKGLYAEIAEKHNETVYKVERAIRHAIDVVFNSGASNLEKYFGNTISLGGEKLVNSAFIFGLVEYIYVHNSKGDD